MKERLLNILDQSTCLTRRQMKDYLAGTMLPEEIHAAETHIASCPLCSMAIEGFEANSEEALAAIASLNSGFLKDHFDSITPQIHLNSMAPAVPVAHHTHHTKKKKNKTYPLLRVAAVAAALILGFGIFWLMDQRGNKMQATGSIAQNEKTAVPGITAPPPMSTDQKTVLPDNGGSKKQELAGKVAAPVASGAPVAAPETEAVEEDNAAAPAAGVAVMADEVAVNKQPAPADVTTKWSADSLNVWSGENRQLSSANAAAPYGNSYTPPSSNNAFQNLQQNPKDLGYATSSAADNKYELKQQSQQSLKYSTRLTAPQTANTGKKRTDTVTMFSPKAVAAARKNEAVISSEKAKSKEAVPETDDEPLIRGDELYGKGNYKAALARYNTAMRSGDKRQRAEATLMAAKCYRNMGNKAKAISLLQSMVDSGGPQKRAAKRMLDELKEK